MTKFLDGYNREIDYLRVAITDRCNLRCRYCMPAEGVEVIDHNKILNYKEIKKIVEVGAKLGIKKVRLTGGEPLARLGVADLVAMLKQISGVEEVSLTTNGILLTKYGEELSAAGLDRVNISLDTLKANKFKEITLFNQHEKVLEGIQTALKLGLDPVKINVVVMKGINDDEVLDFVQFTRKYPVHVRFIEFMPSGDKKLEQEKHYLGIDKLKELIEREEKLLSTEFDTGNGPAYYYQVEDSLGTIGFITPISNHFCSKCNRLRLTTTGKLRPCLYSEKEIDLIENGKLLDKKDLKEQFIKAVHNKPESHSVNNQDSFSTNMSQIGG